MRTIDAAGREVFRGRIVVARTLGEKSAAEQIPGDIGIVCEEVLDTLEAPDKLVESASEWCVFNRWVPNVPFAAHVCFVA